MRRYILRRKDLSHFPFQFYIDRDGAQKRLEPCYTFTFAIEPPRERFAFLHVHILKDFADVLAQQWDIPQADLIRHAAQAMEAWFLGETVPDDHFNDFDMLKVDAAWHPRTADGSPALALNPYRWEVEVDEPWPFVGGKLVSDMAVVEPQPAPTPPGCERCAVFGYTYDIFPGTLIIGYHQLKRKLVDAGVDAVVRMLPIADLPPRVDYLFVPPELAAAAARAAPRSHVEAIDNFLNHPSYNAVVEEWSRNADAAIPHSAAVSSDVD
jgi:hypothetical protein